MSDQQAEYELKQLLEEIRELEGRGTELISLYIPPDQNIQSERDRIRQEYSEAGNIKSKQTRTNVQDALSRTEDVLTRYQQTPKDGLAVFVGRVDGEMREYVFDKLPGQVTEKRYQCDDHFNTDQLEALLAPDEQFGLIVVTRNDSAVGLLAGDRVEMVNDRESGVMGKTRAGGQSAQRFARRRQKQLESHFEKTANMANDAFIEDNELVVEAVVVGGTTGTARDFVDSGYLDYRVKEAIIGRYGVEYAELQGLKQLVGQAEDALRAYRQSEAQEYMDRFLKGLANGQQPVTYGPANVWKALQYGAVETLLLSDTITDETIAAGDFDTVQVESPDDRTVDAFIQQAENTGASVEFVPDGFEAGQQLAGVFQGVAAILRYEV